MMAGVICLRIGPGKRGRGTSYSGLCGEVLPGRGAFLSSQYTGGRVNLVCERVTQSAAK